MVHLRYPLDMQGKLIAAARILLGMTQEELTKRSGISRQTLVSLERDSGNPTKGSEKKVIDVLASEGISFEDTPARLGLFLRKE